MTSRVEAQLGEGIKAADWVPSTPLPSGTSPYVDQVLEFLQVWLAQKLAEIMPMLCPCQGLEGGATPQLHSLSNCRAVRYELWHGDGRQP